MKNVTPQTNEMRLSSAQDMDIAFVANVHASREEVTISLVCIVNVTILIVKYWKDNCVEVQNAVVVNVAYVIVMPNGLVKIVDVHLILLHV